jgi:hypothetical protein
MFYIFWSFSRPIVAILRFSTVKGLHAILTYRYFFKRFWLLYAKEIAKNASFVFLFQYVDSVLFYILSEYLFFDLSLHQNNFKNIFSQDLIGLPRPANKMFRLSAPCCLFYSSYICLALKGTHLMKVYCLFSSYIIEKKKEKSQKT